MATSPQAFLRGVVNRLLPYINSDSSNTDVALRLEPYGGLYTQPLVRKTHGLADEGTYFVANNAQTALAPTYGISFAATSPYLLLYNGNASQRLYLDYAALIAAVAGACTTTAGYIAAAVVIDNINRYSSGGTVLTPVNPNMASPANASGVSVYAGAITATAASGAARMIVGLRNIRPGVSTTVINVTGDLNMLNFGGVEGSVGSVTIANANLMTQNLPPTVVPPGSSVLVYLWFPVMTAPSAATFAPEVGFWVR